MNTVKIRNFLQSNSINLKKLLQRFKLSSNSSQNKEELPLLKVNDPLPPIRKFVSDVAQTIVNNGILREIDHYPLDGPQFFWTYIVDGTDELMTITRFGAPPFRTYRITVSSNKLEDAGLTSVESNLLQGVCDVAIKSFHDKMTRQSITAAESKIEKALEQINQRQIGK